MYVTIDGWQPPTPNSKIKTKKNEFQEGNIINSLYFEIEQRNANCQGYSNLLSIGVHMLKKAAKQTFVRYNPRP